MNGYNNVQIPPFLDGYKTLTDDDMDMLALYEEEQSRRQ